MDYRALIDDIKGTGLSQAAIARAINCNPATICRLRRVSDWGQWDQDIKDRLLRLYWSRVGRTTRFINHINGWQL